MNSFVYNTNNTHDAAQRLTKLKVLLFQSNLINITLSAEKNSRRMKYIVVTTKK